jgi:aryl-alcohol dehydrogenase-like predicted oxidoreductase
MLRYLFWIVWFTPNTKEKMTIIPSTTLHLKLQFISLAVSILAAVEAFSVGSQTIILQQHCGRTVVARIDTCRADTSCSSSSGENNGSDCHIHHDISRRKMIETIKTSAEAAVTATSAAVAVTSSRTAPAVAKDVTVTGTTTNSSRNSQSNIPTVRLGKGFLYVSRTIQGYWQLAGGHGKYSENDAIQNMIQHYDAGITTLDTADIYGPSEVIIGKFIHQQSQRNNGPAVSSLQPTREYTNEIIPMTKFCCFRYLEEIDRNEVRQRILKSCERLQVKQLPLVQFFWSRYDVKRYVDVALYLTELKEEGLIQEIGATNFDLKRLQELKNADVPIVSHQVQLSALDRRPIQSGMANWCFENDISLIGFGTVGSGKYRFYCLHHIIFLNNT